MDNQYKLGLYEKSMPNTLTLEEKLCLTTKHQYDFLEISIDESDEKLGRLWWSNSKRKELSAQIAQSGTPVGTMCLSAHRKYPLGSENPTVAAKSIDIMQRAIDFAVCTGVRVIQIAGYDEYYNEQNQKTEDNFLEKLRICTEIAAANKVVLGFETMETSFMNTCEKAMHYVRLIHSPYLTVYPDTGNLTNAALGSCAVVLRDLQAANGHISAVHLKETMPGVFREVPYGAGHVDFKSVVQKALLLGVRSFTAEFWCVDNSNWEEILKENNQFLRSFFT